MRVPCVFLFIVALGGKETGDLAERSARTSIVVERRGRRNPWPTRHLRPPPFLRKGPRGRRWKTEAGRRCVTPGRPFVTSLARYLTRAARPALGGAVGRDRPIGRSVRIRRRAWAEDERRKGARPVEERRSVKSASGAAGRGQSCVRCGAVRACVPRRADLPSALSRGARAFSGSLQITGTCVRE